VTYDGDWRETFRPDIPVALLFLSILHFVADEADPAGIIAKLLAPFPAGSHVAISHATPDEVPEVNDAERVFDEATTPAHVRSRAAIRDLVDGMDIAESYYCVVVARTN
jgi:S-adenosyl methyltransferase